MSAPPQTGMESLHGRTAVVDRWDGPAGTVTLDGSRWNAYLVPVAGGAPTLTRGTEVRVRGHRGIALEVEPGLGFTPTAPGQRTEPGPPAPPSP